MYQYMSIQYIVLYYRVKRITESEIPGYQRKYIHSLTCTRFGRLLAKRLLFFFFEKHLDIIFEKGERVAREGAAGAE